MKNTNVETLLGTNEKETKRMNKGLRSLLSGVFVIIFDLIISSLT